MVGFLTFVVGGFTMLQVYLILICVNLFCVVLLWFGLRLLDGLYYGFVQVCNLCAGSC